MPDQIGRRAEHRGGVAGMCSFEGFESHENRIGLDGARKLAATLPLCAFLQKVDLSCNIIGDAGAMPLAQAFSQCACLEDVNLASNGIRYTGAFSLARILDECPRLCRLDLNNNRLGDAGAFFFTFALKDQCTSLKHLILA